MKPHLAALLLVAAACGSFPHPSEDYECERDRDCADGRICRSGWCVTGDRTCDVVSCDDFEDCTVDSCAGGECRNEPMADGTPCGGAGSCVSAAVCQSGECLGEPEPPGTPCDDTFYCTEGDSCDGAGGCVGRERDCATSADACTVGSCNEDADTCEDEPAEDYTSCSDGDVCTANDVCHGGSCSGASACECDSSCSTCAGGCCDVNYVGSDCDGEGCPTDCNVTDCACYYGCAGSRCGGECSSDCTVLCSATSECDLACSGDALCNLRCTGANRCDIDCGGNAHCLIDCAGIDDCNRGDCADGWIDCGGDVYACNRPCP
ncbi:MAG TPA: hypothetical protein VFU21_26975 [Kofleriaceae bacterium]|nr:hypothetical protein [Kofleriaceae bacterium]